MLMPIIRSLLLCFVFSLSLIVGLISFLPISVIAHSLQTNIPNLIMGEVTGSWWHGQINNVTWQPLRQASVSWNLDRMALLHGQVVAKIDLSQQSITASTEASLPLSQLMEPRKVEITGAQAKVGIDELTPFAPYPLPKIVGTVTIFVDQLKLDLTQLNNASPQIPMLDLTSPMRFSTSDIMVLEGLSLGQFSGQIANIIDPEGYKITLESGLGPLNISGYSVLTSHNIKSQYVVKSSPKTDPQLTKLLDMMGQRLQNGDYSFNTAYTLWAHHLWRYF